MKSTVQGCQTAHDLIQGFFFAAWERRGQGGKEHKKISHLRVSFLLSLFFFVIGRSREKCGVYCHKKITGYFHV